MYATSTWSFILYFFHHVDVHHGSGPILRPVHPKVDHSDGSLPCRFLIAVVDDIFTQILIVILCTLFVILQIAAETQRLIPERLLGSNPCVESTLPTLVEFRNSGPLDNIHESSSPHDQHGASCLAPDERLIHCSSIILRVPHTTSSGPNSTPRAPAYHSRKPIFC